MQSGQPILNKQIRRWMMASIPSREQQLSFMVHVSEVHSWYKHLPLMNGGEFIVFLNDQVKLRKHPKVFCGSFRYAYKIDDQWFSDYDVDITSIVSELPDIIRMNCSFRLFPTISWEFEEAYSLHKEDINMIFNGIEHPLKEVLLRWNELYLKAGELWQSLQKKNLN